jgi:hypothetical protein
VNQLREVTAQAGALAVIEEALDPSDNLSLRQKLAQIGVAERLRAGLVEAQQGVQARIIDAKTEEQRRMAASAANAAEIASHPFRLELTCDQGSARKALSACLNSNAADSGLEFRSDEIAIVMKGTQTAKLGDHWVRNAQPSYRLKARNSHAEFKLTLTLTNRTNNTIIFTRSAGQYEVIELTQ